MSSTPAKTEKEVANLTELTAEELIMRGERMVALGRELLGLAAQLEGSERPVAPHEVRRLEEPKRSVGRFGEVTSGIALSRARDLGDFSTREFAEALGLPPAGAMKWISALLHQEPAVLTHDQGRYVCLLPPELKVYAVRTKMFTYDEAAQATKLEGTALDDALERLEDEGVIREVEDGIYEYVPPEEDGPNEHPHGRAPEHMVGYQDAPRRGEPVRIRTERKQRGGRSTPGQRQKIINNELQWQRMEDAKARRAEENRRKAAETRAKKGRRK